MMKLSVVAVLLAACCFASLIVSSEAHGFVSTPKSRQYQCQLGLVTNCGPVMYEPQSVEALKGKRSCSGDVSTWAPLDDNTKAWVVNPVARGTVQFTWTQPAPHPPASWEYWIGGTRVAFLTNTANTTHCINLAGYSGYQKVLAIWNIADTANAFYSCVDVNVGAGTTTGVCTNGGADVVTPLPPVPSTARAATTIRSSSTGGAAARVCASSTYHVVSGDTLNAIATAKGVTLTALLAANPTITNPNLIYVGQQIAIPGTCKSSSTAGIRYISSTARRRSAAEEGATGGQEDAEAPSEPSSESGAAAADTAAESSDSGAAASGDQVAAGSTAGSAATTGTPALNANKNAASTTSPPILLLSAVVVVMGLLL